MDKKKILLLMIVVLIAILVMFNVKINNYTKAFEKDCANVYDINGSCYCFQTRPDPNPFFPEKSEFNLSDLNLTSIH